LQELYNARITEKRKKRSRIAGYAALITAAAGQLACVVMCALTNTGNAAAMERSAVITAVVSGWAAIFIYLNIYENAKRDYKHSQLLASCDKPGEYTGTLEFTGRNADIKDSVSVCGLALTDSGGRHLLNVERSRAGALKGVKGKVRLYTAHGFVTAFEEVEG